MSPGKLAAQVSHASIAFLTWPLREEHFYYGFPIQQNKYYIEQEIEKDIIDNWICGSFTKVICEAKNRYQLEKIIPIAQELDLKENKDFFLIKDSCYTELAPEEVDENEQGCTLTCIGFRPLPDDICTKLSKKYQLYR